MRKDFYVYAFLREDRSTPYYIGKGTRRRTQAVTNRTTAIPKDRSRVVKIKEGLTNEEAMELEALLILQWGRKDIGTGILHNFTDGGEPGTHGRKATEEQKQKARETIKKTLRAKHPEWYARTPEEKLERKRKSGREYARRKALAKR